jgi:hypothetical protein
MIRIIAASQIDFLVSWRLFVMLQEAKGGRSSFVTLLVMLVYS